MDGWADLYVPKPVLRALCDLGYTKPTPIQEASLPAAIRDRRDIVGAAETVSLSSWMPGNYCHKHFFLKFLAIVERFLVFSSTRSV
jgi:hypothetical protein